MLLKDGHLGEQFLVREGEATGGNEEVEAIGGAVGEEWAVHDIETASGLGYR